MYTVHFEQWIRSYSAWMNPDKQKWSHILFSEMSSLITHWCSFDSFSSCCHNFFCHPASNGLKTKLWIFFLTNDCWYSGLPHSYYQCGVLLTPFYTIWWHRCSFCSSEFLWLSTGLIVFCNGVQSSYLSGEYHYQWKPKHCNRRYLRYYTQSENDWHQSYLCLQVNNIWKFS